VKQQYNTLATGRLVTGPGRVAEWSGRQRVRITGLDGGRLVAARCACPAPGMVAPGGYARGAPSAPAYGLRLAGCGLHYAAELLLQCC
jgi:hypothetical protein